jgi:hypothetical protein
MKIFKTKTKSVSELIVDKKHYTENIQDSFNNILDNNTSKYPKDVKPKLDNRCAKWYKKALKAQAELLKVKMQIQYINVGIKELPKDWKKTNAYKIYDLSNLKQIVGYLEATKDRLKTKERQYFGKTYVFYNEFDDAYITKEVNKYKAQINEIEQQLAVFNDNTKINCE